MYGRQRDPVQELAKKTQRGFEQHAGQLAALQRQYQGLANQFARTAYQSQADRTMDELKRGEEHYTQVVMLAGYAGFFTLWTQTRTGMSLWMFASTGALIAFSLFVFVGFELYKTWRMGRYYQSNPNPNPQGINQHYAEINKHWHVIFILSAGSGVLAGLSLLFWFVYKTILSAAGMAGAA